MKVPAGKSASVGYTVNTKLGGTLDGAYSSYVTATAGAQSVRTGAAVNREVESYDLVVKHIDRAGQPTGEYNTIVEGYSGLAAGSGYQVPTATTGTTTMRLPKGTYLLDAWIAKDFTKPDLGGEGLDWVVQPKLTLTKNTAVTIDARTTKAADITVPDAGAEPLGAMVSYMFDTPGIGIGVSLDSFANLRLAHLGAEVPGLSQTWFGQFAKGSGVEYDAITTAKVKKIQGDKVRHFKASEFAKVANRLGGGSPGKTGALGVIAFLPEDAAFGRLVEQTLPGTRTAYVSTGEKVEWLFDFTQFKGKDAQGFSIPEAYYTMGDLQKLKPGGNYARTFNAGVFGPRLLPEFGLFREGNFIYGLIPLFADGAGHPGSSDFTSVATTLYRNGKKVGTNNDPLFAEKAFTVPAGDAAYQLTTSVKRSVKVAQASTRIDASWTFRSKKSAADMVQLPASSLRFNAAVGLDNKVAAGQRATFPVVVEGAARGSNLKSLSVYASYDYGKTWKKLTVKNGKVTVVNPKKGAAISYHAKITDKKGNKSTISIYNAYYGK